MKHYKATLLLIGKPSKEFDTLENAKKWVESELKQYNSFFNPWRVTYEITDENGKHICGWNLSIYDNKGNIID